MKKELLYAWVANGFHVLVPKKRREGFFNQNDYVHVTGGKELRFY